MLCDCNEGRFLDYLGRIESCAAAGYADIALLPSLVLPDVLGTYLCGKRGLLPAGKSGGKSGGKYKAAMRKLLLFDKELYGFSRFCYEFGVFGIDGCSLNRVRRTKCATRCTRCGAVWRTAGILGLGICRMSLTSWTRSRL